MWRRAVVGIGLLVVLGLIGFAISAAFGGSTPPVAGSSTTTTVTTPAAKQLEVGVRTLSFTDPSRMTYNFTTGKTLTGRTVGVEIDYPTYLGSPDTETPNVAIVSRKSYPLIVFASGYRLRPQNYSTLIDSWVKAGFLVAALEFPDTTYPATVAPYKAHLPNGTPETDMYKEEPGDVAFAIRELDAATTTKNNWLDGLINKNAIVLAGHSDGGDVVAALVYDAAARISGVSVRGVAVLSGAEFAVANQTYSQPTGPVVPLLVVQSTNDVCNFPSSAVQLYNAIGAPKYYLDLASATHLGAYDGANPQPSAVVVRTTVAFFQGVIGTSAISTPTLSAQATEAGVSTLLTSSVLPPIQAPSATTTCPFD